MRKLGQAWRRLQCLSLGVNQSIPDEHDDLLLSLDLIEQDGDACVVTRQGQRWLNEAAPDRHAHVMFPNDVPRAFDNG